MEAQIKMSSTGVIANNQYASQAVPANDLDIPAPTKESTVKRSRGLLPKVVNNDVLDHRGAIIVDTKAFDPSLKESIPYKKTYTIDSVTKTIGEYPLVPFYQLIWYREATPQLDVVAEYLTDLVIGTDVNINCDDEAAKELCEDFKTNVHLYEKLKTVVDISLTTGFGMFAKVYDTTGALHNLEEFDVSTLTRAHRDKYGNVQFYIQHIGATGEMKITDVENYIPVVLRKRGRDHFGRSFFHSLALPRTSGGRTTRPLIEHIWSMEDAMVGTFENHAYPMMMFTYPNADDDILEKEAQRIKEFKPGDKIVQRERPIVDTFEVNSQGKFDSYVKHMEETFQLGTGFPYDILLGDFAAKASSETTDTLLMRKVKSYQTYLCKLLKEEVFEELLRTHKESKWKTDAAVKNINVEITFESKTPTIYTPEQVQQRFISKVWSVEEIRQYDKNNGQDLFDDELVKAAVAKDEAMQQKQMMNPTAGPLSIPPSKNNKPDAKPKPKTK